jgi:hypothetical protein
MVTRIALDWIAQLTTGTGEEVPDDQAVKKMRGVLKEARSGQTSFSPEELALIEEWVPPTLSLGVRLFNTPEGEAGDFWSHLVPPHGRSRQCRLVRS